MAKIIDPLDSQQELNLQEGDELINLLEEEVSKEQESTNTSNTATEQPQQTTDKEEQKPTLPEKYENKSLEDIVQMHQEAEKLLGRQSTEVGELRKIVDNFIKNKAEETRQTETKTTSEPEIDFFDNPQEAVNKAISSSEEVKQMKELLAKQQQQDIITKISAKHPDYVEIVQDTNFVEWVKGSPVRIELLQRADKYDFDAADEILSSWKERKDFVNKAKEVNEQDRKQQRKAATTGGKGSSEPASRKIYKRADIVNLMIKNPERYKANIDEFEKAYREGRVK